MSVKCWMIVLVSSLLAGCGNSGGGQGTGAVAPAATSAGIAAECKLLMQAMAQVKTASGKQDLTIVAGCPGYENAPDSAGQLEEAARFTRAASASVPVHVRVDGDTAIRIFQRMISRGTPVKIATNLSSSAAFKAAVAAQK